MEFPAKLDVTVSMGDYPNLSEEHLEVDDRGSTYENSSTYIPD